MEKAQNSKSLFLKNAVGNFALTVSAPALFYGWIPLFLVDIYYTYNLLGNIWTTAGLTVLFIILFFGKPSVPTALCVIIFICGEDYRLISGLASIISLWGCLLSDGEFMWVVEVLPDAYADFRQKIKDWMNA